MVECRVMTSEDRQSAFTLLRAFLAEDEFYLDSSAAYGDGGEPALRRALDLMLAHPSIGFVWLAFDAGQAVAVSVVSFAVSTSIGAIVAKLDDVFVEATQRGKGVGSEHLQQLKTELKRRGIERIDVGVHRDNTSAYRFYERHGFRSLGEERFACLLD